MRICVDFSYCMILEDNVRFLSMSFTSSLMYMNLADLRPNDAFPYFNTRE